MRIVLQEMVDWMCFAGETSLALPAGPIAVVGRYEDRAGRSNWSGKTALLEAIRWCLWGIHRKSHEDRLITRGAERTEVRLLLGSGGPDHLRVKRARPRGGPTRLTVTTADGTTFQQKAAEAALEKFLRMDERTALETLVFSQGDVEAVVGRTSGDRIAAIRRWFGLERAAAAAEKTRKLATSRVSLLSAARTAAPAEVKQAEVEAAEKAAAVAAAAFDEAHADWQKAATDWKELDSLRKLRDDAKTYADAVGRAKDLRAKLEGGTVGRLQEATRKAVEEDEAARAEYSAAIAERDEAARLAAGEFDGVCPVTCAECPVADDVRADRDAALKRLATAEARVAEARPRAAAAQRARDAARRESEDAAVNVRLFNAAVANARTIEKRAKEYADLGKDVDALNEERRRALEETVERRAAAKAEVERALGALRIEKAARERWLEHEQKLTQLGAGAAAALLAARAIAVGARSVAEQSVLALEEQVAPQLSAAGLSASFSWERALDELEGSCGACGRVYKGQREKACPDCGAERAPRTAEDFEILIDDGSGEIEDVSEKSGGAQALVGSAIRLAAARLVRSRRESPLAFALVDEPFGALDVQNRAELARVLTTMMGATGLEQALVVSHHPDLLDALPHRVVITRSERRRISTAEVL